MGKAAKALEEQATKGTDNGTTGGEQGAWACRRKEKALRMLRFQHALLPFCSFSYQTGVFSVLTQKSLAPNLQPQESTPTSLGTLFLSISSLQPP